MRKAKLPVLAAILVLTLTAALAACGRSGTAPAEKIAVLQWEEVLRQHPQQAKLRLGEAVLQELLGRRGEQERQARSQLGSLSKLQGLQEASERNYLAADYDTRMFEARQIEQGRLEKRLAEAEAEAEELVAERRRQIEEEYRLRLFNLRLQLENARPSPEKDARMTPAERRQFEQQAKMQLEQESQQLKRERGSRIMQLEEEKKRQVEILLSPYVAQMRESLTARASELQQGVEEQLAQSEERRSRLLQEAPEALQNVLVVLDREITRQREKNDSLRREMEQDAESLAGKLARERGYTLVLRGFAANVQADDITQDIISALNDNKKQK